MRLHCCCCLAATIAVAYAIANPRWLFHYVVTSVAAVLLLPLPQINICAAHVYVTAISLSPCCLPAISAKSSLLCYRRFFLDVYITSIPPLPPGPAREVCASTIPDIFPLLLLLLTLPPSQAHSATMLSQLLLQSCHSLCHKSIFAPLPLLSPPSLCSLATSVPSSQSQVYSTTVVVVLKLLPPLCCLCLQVL